MRTGKLDDTKDVLCPFYAWHEKQRVNCEGIDGAVNLGMLFKTELQREGHMLSRCGAQYKKCPVYKLLMQQKYPDA